MLTKEETCELLRDMGVNYELKQHIAAFTIEDIDKTGIDERGEVAKNLFLRNDNGKQHYLIVVKKEKNCDLAMIRSEIKSSRLSFASPERLMDRLGLTKGAVTPLGVFNDEERHVKVYLDREVMDMDRIGVHPCDNTATVFLSPKELVRIIREHGNTLDLIDV